MIEAIRANLTKFSEDMLLHYASPNRNLIAEILTLDAANLSQLHREQLSQYVLALGQYLVMLQYNENLTAVEYMLLSKTYEHKINSAQFIYKDIEGKTEKAKKAWVLLNVPEINELHGKLLAAEAEKLMIDNMVKAAEGLLNALKKELSNHYTG